MERMSKKVLRQKMVLMCAAAHLVYIPLFAIIKWCIQEKQIEIIEKYNVQAMAFQPCSAPVEAASMVRTYTVTYASPRMNDDRFEYVMDIETEVMGKNESPAASYHPGIPLYRVKLHVCKPCHQIQYPGLESPKNGLYHAHILQHKASPCEVCGHGKPLIYQPPRTI